MGHTEKDPTSIFYDNRSVIQLSKHNILHRKIKHINTCYHFIRDLDNDGQISLQFCGSKGGYMICSPNHWEQLYLNIRERTYALAVMKTFYELRLRMYVEECNLTGRMHH